MRLIHRVLGTFSLVLALAAGATPAAVAQTATTANRVAEIPVETLFKKAAFRRIALSPDGKFLAALAPLNGRQNLTVVDLEKRAGTILTNFSTGDVNTIFWASNNRLIYTTGDQQGLEFRGDGGLFAIDRNGDNPRTLVKPVREDSALKFVFRETTVLQRIKGNSDEVLVEANDRSADTQDLYRMNIQSGRKVLVNTSSPGNVIRWVLDNDEQPRATLSMDMKKKRWWFSYRSGDSDTWQTLAQWNEQLRDVIIPLAFDPADKQMMYVASNVGRETLALFKFNPATGKLGELVYGDDRYDIASLELLGTEAQDENVSPLLFGGTREAPGKLLGLRYQANKLKTVWFDENAMRTQAMVDATLPETLNTFPINPRRTLVYSRSDVNPGEWYIFDQDKRSLETTGIAARPNIDPKQMVAMRPVSWTARDGVRIDGYLTLPRGYQSGKPVPLVLHPHGGPWARDEWRFDPEVQFLANRGNAVLQVNFRGSTGYGAQHLRLSYKHWGDSMIDDMIDGVEWAMKQGYADPQRVAVYGASYGGYATLMAMVRRPDLFKWGVNYVGVTDMTVHQDTQTGQLHGDFAELAKVINGDQRIDAALFDQQSPARHVAVISAPVFHAYGGEDQNVDFANGRTIRSAFDNAKKPYEWMFVADEAHGYRQEKNIFEFYKRFDAFMKKNMQVAN